MLVVTALGGNALLRKGEKPSLRNQEKNVRLAANSIKEIANKHKIIITHGNGPQVGNIMIQIESALGKAYPVPLHVAVAESEGEIGYILEQALHGVIQKPIVSILTRVVIDKRDPAFRKPTKPIGPYYNKKKATRIKRKGYKMERINGGWRRVVASPRPIRIVESPIIKKLARDVVVIAAGGGGIPVDKDGKGIDAVVDKDLASACLATSVGAKILIILTDVPCAYTNFGKRDQKEIRMLNIKRAKQLLKEGHFPSGSMGPKIIAAMDFAKYGGKTIITNFASLKRALRGKAGTTVIR